MLSVLSVLCKISDLTVPERVNAIFSDKAESEVAVNRKNVDQAGVGCGRRNKKCLSALLEEISF